MSLYPIFVGQSRCPETNAKEHIILYRSTEGQGPVDLELYVRVNGGDVQKVDIDQFAIWEDMGAEVLHINLESEQWSGTAAGNRYDMMWEEPVVVP